MEQFGQQLVNGLTLGSVYALVALSFTLVFGVLKLIAFAQGGVYMVGAYVGLFAVNGLHSGNRAVGLLCAAVVAAGAGALLNVAIDRVGYRPIRSSRRLMALISGIGIYTVLENGAGLGFGLQPRPYPALLPGGTISAPVVVSWSQLTVVAVAVVAMAGLYLFIHRSGMGLAIRATAERPAAAGLMGIEVERIIMATFALAGALSGVAGVLVGSYTGVATPTMGFLIGIKAFAAAVIGGIGNVPGALFGGIVIGLVEAMGAGYLSSAWSDAIVFAALVLVLLVRPAGLFGSTAAEKV